MRAWVIVAADVEWDDYFVPVQALLLSGIACWVLLYCLGKWRDGNSSTRPFWRTFLRRIIILIGGALALWVFIGTVRGGHHHRQAANQAEMQLRIEKNRIGIEKNQVRRGMTINDVLPLVHGMGITASAVVDINKVGYYAPDRFELGRLDDGTFTLSGYWGKRVSGNLTQIQAAEQMNKPEQVLQNLTKSQAAEVINQKMSDGYEWRWQYTFHTGEYLLSFNVIFGRDGRVKDITDLSSSKDVRPTPA